MITDICWFRSFGLALIAILVIGVRFKQWVAATVLAVLLVIAIWAIYYSHFQQLFVKNGGRDELNRTRVAAAP